MIVIRQDAPGINSCSSLFAYLKQRHFTFSHSFVAALDNVRVFIASTRDNELALSSELPVGRRMPGTLCSAAILDGLASLFGRQSAIVVHEE